MKRIFLVLMVSACLLIFASLTSQPESQTAKVGVITEAKIIVPPTVTELETKLNAFRVSKGLSELSDNPTLDQAAQVRAEGMCNDNDWSHDKAWDVLGQYYSYSHAGENLYNAPLRVNQADNAMSLWANSPEHLDNMVGDYIQIGFGVKVCPVFQNETNDVIITNYFGVPQ